MSNPDPADPADPTRNTAAVLPAPVDPLVRAAGDVSLALGVALRRLAPRR